MDLGPRISQLLDSIRSITSNQVIPSQHLNHTLIRIERGWIEFSRSIDPRQSSTSSEEREKSSRKLKSLLLELIEVLGDEKKNLLPTFSSQQSSQYNLLATTVHDIVLELGKATTLVQGSLTPERRRKLPVDSSNLQSPLATTTSLPIDSLFSLNSQSSNNVFPSKALADVYTLYSLVNFPSRILPPGKTLSSLLKTEASTSKEKEIEVSVEDGNSLESRVRKTVEAAYFDEIISVLSSTTSSSEEKNAKWAQCLRDLWEASSPLIPGRMKEKVALQVEFTSPATFSILDATYTLHRLVSILAKLIAPIRDSEVYKLLSSISSPSLSSSIPSSSTSTMPSSTLSSLIPSTFLNIKELIAAVQCTLAFTIIMQADLNQFKKNLIQSTSPTEQELNGLIRSETKRREREVVEKYYRDLGLELKKEVRDWVGRNGEMASGNSGTSTVLERNNLLANRLVETVFAEVAVGFPSISTSLSTTENFPLLPQNILPPLFIIPSPTLYKLQNDIQALIILACLLSLVPLASEELTDRLWILLSTDNSNEADTKLANLSDEIIRSTIDTSCDVEVVEKESNRIKTGVERILKYDDPVYKLLKSRLLLCLKEGLRTSQDSSNSSTSNEIPIGMRSGRVVGESRTEGVVSESQVISRFNLSTAKGFEKHQVLRKQVLVVAKELELILSWSLNLWSDVLLL